MKPTKLIARGLAFGLTAVLMLAMTVQAAPAPGAEPYQVELRPLEAPPNVEAIIPVQGRLLDASGHPVTDGPYDLTLRVRDGTGVLCTSGPTSVQTDNGLFIAHLSGCSSSIFDGRPLSLGIQVGLDAEMEPVQTIYPVPYAMSLRPGAIVANSDNDGHGLEVKGSAPGVDSALYTENNDADGIAIWSTTTSGNATVVIENFGSGPLLKGFGGDGGEDEFRIGNDGSIQSKTHSTVFVPGIEAVIWTGSHQDTTLDNYQCGAVTVHPGQTGIAQRILIPVALPGVLYGQPVRVESLTVHYKTSSALTYISSTILWRQTAAGPGDSVSVFLDYADRTSTTYTSYTLSEASNNIIDDGNGLLTVELTLIFNSLSDTITIGGVDISLWHHSLNAD